VARQGRTGTRERLITGRHRTRTHAITTGTYGSCAVWDVRARTGLNRRAGAAEVLLRPCPDMTRSGYGPPNPIQLIGVHGDRSGDLIAGVSLGVPGNHGGIFG
jgi:hypothetical protein